MIDFHYHSSSYSHNCWSPPNTVESILREMDELGIEKRLIFPYFNPNGYISSQANSEAITQCLESPSRLVPVMRARTPVDFRHEWKAKLAALRSEFSHSLLLTNLFGAVRHMCNRANHGMSINDLSSPLLGELIDGRFPALKFHAEEDGSLTSALFSLVQKRFRLLILHINPFELGDLLRKSGLAPGCHIIVAHMGSLNMIPRQLDKAVDLTVQYSNVYVDSSGIYATNIIQNYLPRFSSKIVFGSDGPCFSTRAALELHRETGVVETLERNSAYLADKLALT